MESFTQSAGTEKQAFGVSLNEHYLTNSALCRIGSILEIMLALFPYVYMVDGLGEGRIMCKTICVIISVIGIAMCAYLVYCVYFSTCNESFLDA